MRRVCRVAALLATVAATACWYDAEQHSHAIGDVVQRPNDSRFVVLVTHTSYRVSSLLGFLPDPKPNITRQYPTDVYRGNTADTTIVRVGSLVFPDETRQYGVNVEGTAGDSVYFSEYECAEGNCADKRATVRLIRAGPSAVDVVQSLPAGVQPWDRLICDALDPKPCLMLTTAGFTDTLFAVFNYAFDKAKPLYVLKGDQLVPLKTVGRQ